MSEVAGSAGPDEKGGAVEHASTAERRVRDAIQLAHADDGSWARLAQLFDDPWPER